MTTTKQRWAMPRLDVAIEFDRNVRVGFDCPQDGRLTGKVIRTLRNISNGALTAEVELDLQPGAIRHLYLSEIDELHADFHNPQVIPIPSIDMKQGAST